MVNKEYYKENDGMLWENAPDENLYICNNTGTLGETQPTHTNGTEMNGDISLTWISKLAKLEVVTI